MAKTGALGYKVDNEYTPQVTGLATIKVGETFALVTFDEGSKEFDNGTNKKKIKLEDMPKVPKLTATPAGESGKKYRIRLNKDGDAVESLIPAEGHFVAKIMDFRRRQTPDSDPEPYEKTFEKGGEKSTHLEFTVLYKVSKGFAKGCVIPHYLHYKFSDNGDGFATFAGNPDNPQASRLHQLIDWCNKHGLIDEPISWPEDGNILPVLLDRALEADKEVELIVKDGKIIKDGLLAIDSYEEAEDEPKPTKKAPAPATKKVVKKDADEDDDL